MNALRDYIEAFKLDETAVLNLLQDHGIISDECVLAEEVGDSGKAISWLELNRDADGDHTKPKLSNLRESGSIEQDADTVLLIHRLDKNKKRADEDAEPMDHNTLLILAKQRNGPTPEIKLNFIGEHTVFRNVTEKQYSNNMNQRQK